MWEGCSKQLYVMNEDATNRIRMPEGQTLDIAGKPLLEV
jgi:hypothetical protein